MKMPNELFNELKSAMMEVSPVDGRTIAEHRQQYADDGLSYGRWLYDWMHASKPGGEPDYRWVCDKVYPLGMNDTHMTTPLKKIDREAFGAWPNPASQTLNGKRIA
jgi:hypothetical protein